MNSCLSGPTPLFPRPPICDENILPKTTVNKFLVQKTSAIIYQVMQLAAPALHKMSDRDATTTMSNLVDAGDDDVQIVYDGVHH